MSESIKFLAYQLEHQFPHPIAAPYRCAQTSLRSSDRAAYLLATLDGFLRHTATILLSDLFSKGPAGQQVEASLQVLRYPTLERWAELVIDISRQIGQRSPFMPELCSALCYKNGKVTQSGSALRTLATRSWQLLQEKTALVDEDAAREVVESLGTELERFLSKFAFLEKYPLVEFRTHASQPDEGFRGFMLQWMGYRTHPLPISVEFDGVVPLNRLLLLSPDGTRGLELEPFTKLVRTPNRPNEGLFLLAGLRNEQTLRLECFTTGRFATVDLEVEDVPATLDIFMESWAGGGRIASLTPSSATAKRLRFKSKLLPAEKILEGRYKALGFVGRGGIGVVYRIYDMEEGIDKAVKILYPDLSRNEFFTRYFLETGAQLAKLEHPNLVPVYEADYSSTLQENHILMAHMRGGSLAELLERKETVGCKEALRVTFGILEALGHLHQNDLVHGDIHPGNILFDLDSTPRLADFGILRLHSSRVTTFRPLERLHSLRYASPELLLGGQATKSSDVYSVAIVLYEMLTGQVPSKTSFIPPSELIFPVPESLDEVLARALAARPEERYLTPQMLQDALLETFADMGPEYEISPTAQAQQLAGHLSDVNAGHMEHLDEERLENMAAEDFEAAARLLSMKVDELWDIDEKVHWMQELAKLHFERLDSPDRAVAILRDCLELAPDNPAAVQAIMLHFEKTEQWQELCTLLDELREQTDQEEQDVDYLRKLVEVYHDHLNDGAKAAEYLECLVEKTGAEAQWIELLVTLKEEAQDWDGAARALNHWLEEASAKSHIVGILRRLGAIYHEHLEDHEAAISTLERLLELEPEDRETLDSLRRLYRLSFSYSSLRNLLRRMIDSSLYEVDELNELYQELGEIVSSYVYDTTEALRVWNELLERDPENQTALAYLERLYLREGQNDNYLDILERKSKVVSSPAEKAGVLLTAALAKMEFSADIDGARAFLEQGIELASGHSGIEAALERLYEEHGDLEAQSHLLLSKLEREKKPAVRKEILWKLTSLFEESGDLPAAYEVVKRAFSEAPTDPVVRKELERLAEDVKAYEGLVTFYMEALASASAEEQTYLAGRISHYCVHHIDERDKAVYALEQALELAGDSIYLHKSLLSLYRESNQWEKLALLMLRHAKVVDQIRRRELFEEVALLVKNQVGATKGGVQVLRELVDLAAALGPDFPRTALRQTARELEQWNLVLELAQRELEGEEDPARAQELRRELGRANMELGEPGRARTWLESALDKAPHDEAIQDELEAVLAGAEDWEGLVRFYKRLMPQAERAERKQSYMEKAAQIERDVFEHLDSAAELYRQLVSLEPDRSEYGLALADVLKKAERYPELSRHYEQMLPRLEGEEKQQLLREMAAVYYEQLNNADAAIQTLRQVVKDAPEDEESFLKVRQICGEEKRYETLLRLLGERARRVQDSEKLHLKVEMARISAEKMGLLPAAKAYLDEVLKLEPAHQEAFEFYRELLTRQEDWKGLAELLNSRFENVQDEAVRAEVGLTLARLYMEHLDLKVRASEVLERVWETQPDNTGAALMLAQLYALMSRWDKTASMLSVLQELADSLDEQGRTELVFLSALTYESLLQRPRAIQSYREALERSYRVDEAKTKLATLLYMEEEYDEARDLIAELLAGDSLPDEKKRELQNLGADIDRKLGRRDRSREHLEKLLSESPGNKEVLGKLIALGKETGDPACEMEFTQRLLEVETDPELRFPLLVRWGDLARTLPEHGEEAVTAYEKAFEIKPSSKGLAISLGQQLMALERFEDATAWLKEAEALETDRSRQAALALTQGLLCVEHLEDPEQAAVHLRRCLELEPGKWEAFTILEKLAVESGNWDQQRELYLFMLETLKEDGDPELLFKLNLNLGRILLEKFGESQKALFHLEAASAIRPEDPEPQQIAVGIHLQTEDSLDQGLAYCRGLVAKSPRDVGLLNLLRKTYSKMKRFDEAWYVAGILELLDAASPKEKAFYQKFSSSALKIKPKVVDVDLFQATMLPPEEDWELTEIIRILHDRMAGRLNLPAPKVLGLTRKTAFADAQAPLLAKLVPIMAKVLGITKPPIYVRDTKGWILKEACHPPALVLGEEVLQNRKGKDLRFELAKMLTLFLPHHQAAGLLDVETLRLLLGNVLKMLVASFPDPPGDPKRNAELRREMERAIPSVELGRIRELVGELREKGGELSVKRWLVGVEKTAHRFGLVFANDIQVGAQLARTCPMHLSVASREELVEDMIRFAISEEFTRLRRFLGISVV